MEERNIKISLDKARKWYKKGGELKEIALSAFSENEITTSALPNTWEEFCEMHPKKINEWHINDDSNIKSLKKVGEQHLAQIKLHQLRDCYRQGWLPDWEDNDIIKYCIVLESNRYVIYRNFITCNFLSFQTMELAEKFLNNFKYLIETAGDLI